MSLAARIGRPEKGTALWILVPLLALATGVQPAVAGPTGAGRQSLPPSSWLGESAVEVQMLKGGSTWVEGAKRTFAGARWDFFTNGTFRFTPAPAADVRNDLYPLVGSYTRIGDRVLLQATRLADLGASASLVGAVWGFPAAPRLVILKSTVSGISSEIVLITQSLRPARENTVARGWPPVPSTFTIVLHGTVAGEPFGPLSGVLALCPPAEGDSNPFLLRLETNDQDRQGSLSWTSFLAASEPRARFNSISVRPQEKEIVAQLLPGVKHLLAPYWTRLVPHPEIPGLGSLADVEFPEEGAVHLRLNGRHVSGEIVASRHVEPSGKILYQGRLEGEVQEAAAAEQPAGYGNPFAGETLFGGDWRSERFGEFHLQQDGGSVHGTLGTAGRTELTGKADGNVLAVHWREPAGGEGAGFLVALSDRRQLAGLLVGAAPNAWRAFIAARGAPPPRPPLQAQASSREELKDRGNGLVLQGRCLEAVDLLEQARILYRQDREHPELWDLKRDSALIDELNILTRLSVCYTELKRLDDLLGSVRDYLRTLRLLAAKGYLKSVVVQGSTDTLDQLTGPLAVYTREMTSDVEKIQVQDAGRAFFEELVELLLEMDQPAAALVASEKARARAFVELLSAGAPRRSISDVEIASPGKPLLVTAENLKAAVQRLRTTAVEYLITDQRLMIWVVSPEGKIQVESVPVAREQVEKAVHDLLALNSAQAAGAVADRRQERGLERIPVAGQEGRQREILRQLYDLLIAPIAKHLPQPASPAPAITFVPQGQLFLVPFPALLDAQNRAFIDSFTPSIAPSIGALASVESYPSTRWAAGDVLVAGNPALPPSYASLPSLTGAEREARAVAARFHTAPLLGAAATREAALAAMPRSRLIHLASHGLLEYGDEDEIPGALVFAARQGDGLLTAREIAGLHLRSELVVLSACDSGAGRITGDGVVGLARSFLVAGAKGVVVSLWQANDEATEQLMAAFYDHLERTGDRAGALREAMLATRKSFPEPGKWAGFTFIGIEPEKVSPATQGNM